MDGHAAREPPIREKTNMNTLLGDPAWWHRIPSAFTIIDPLLVQRDHTGKANLSKYNHAPS